jgi:tetratricopeptide (TPR) repeat protein
LSDNQDKYGKDNANKDTHIHQKNITTNEGININKNYLDDLDSNFKNTIEEFIKKLNSNLIDVSIPQEQRKALENQIEEIARKIKEIPINKKTQNDIPTDLLQSFSQDNNKPIPCNHKDLEINPENADEYNNKGLSLYYLGDNNEAIECYDKALEINPQNADAYYNKGLSLSTLKNYPEAIECYDKALEMQSDNVNALNKKAWDLVNHFPARLQEASEIIKKAIGLDPANINIVHTYGYILDRLQTHKEAIIVYEHIMKQSPSFSNVWYDCARAKIKLDDKDIQNCISDLQKAIELNPVYKEKAKHESDFEFIKNNPDFKRIIEV